MQSLQIHEVPGNGPFDIDGLDTEVRDTVCEGALAVE